MWNYILTFLIGAAIPIVTFWLQSIQRKRYFHLDVKEKLKYVAIEKRLEAHQKAFKYWWQMFDILKEPNDNHIKNEVLKNSRDFWESNALYLEEKTRKGFLDAIKIAETLHDSLNYVRKATVHEEKKDAKKVYYRDWDYFMDLITTIQQEVELEPIKPNVAAPLIEE